MGSDTHDADRQPIEASLGHEVRARRIAAAAARLRRARPWVVLTIFGAHGLQTRELAPVGANLCATIAMR